MRPFPRPLATERLRRFRKGPWCSEAAAPANMPESIFAKPFPLVSPIRKGADGARRPDAAVIASNGNSSFIDRHPNQSYGPRSKRSREFREKSRRFSRKIPTGTRPTACPRASSNDKRNKSHSRQHTIRPISPARAAGELPATTPLFHLFRRHIVVKYTFL